MSAKLYKLIIVCFDSRTLICKVIKRVVEYKAHCSPWGCAGVKGAGLNLCDMLYNLCVCIICGPCRLGLAPFWLDLAPPWSHSSTFYAIFNAFWSTGVEGGITVNPRGRMCCEMMKWVCLRLSVVVLQLIHPNSNFYPTAGRWTESQDMRENAYCECWLINNAQFVMACLVLFTARPPALYGVLQALWIFMCSMTFFIPPTCWSGTLSVFQGISNLQIKHWEEA